MASKAEYDDLVSQKTKAQGQYKACEDRIDDYDYLLKRLRQKKEWVTSLKESYKVHKKTTAELHEEDHKWTGSTYNSFNRKMNAVESADETYYKDSLDHVLDSINDEITRIENLKSEEKGLLGWLGARINSLANKIENFFN